MNSIPSGFTRSALLLLAVTFGGTAFGAVRPSQEKVLAAVQRSTIQRLPAFAAIKNVEFNVISQVDENTSISGTATIEVLEDTYVSIERMGISRASGDIAVVVVKPVQARGTKLRVPFQGVISSLDASPRLDVSLQQLGALGQVRSGFKACLIQGSELHEKALGYERAFGEANEKAKLVLKKWTELQRMKLLVEDGDKFALEARNGTNMANALKRTFDDLELANEYQRTVAKAKNYPNSGARHAAFVRLVGPSLRKEYPRVEAIVMDAKSKADQYAEFLLGL